MGKGARRNQSRVMNRMNRMAEEQFDYYKGKQEAQEIVTAKQRADFEAFKFENPLKEWKTCMKI